VIAELLLQPILKTERLHLRPFTLADAKTVQLLAGDKRIAQMTQTIPHPYPDGAAENWISGHAAAFRQKTEIVFAIELQASDQLIGAASLLHIDKDQSSAEIGYWIGVPYWGLGYATEAVLGLLQFAQIELQLRQFTGRCFAHNIASANVLKKAGLVQQQDLSEQIINTGAEEQRFFLGSARKLRLMHYFS
jgi:[ribosomal protein S5]-alanine N-acetyltransferase